MRSWGIAQTRPPAAGTRPSRDGAERAQRTRRRCRAGRRCPDPRTCGSRAAPRARRPPDMRLACRRAPDTQTWPVRPTRISTPGHLARVPPAPRRPTRVSAPGHLARRPRWPQRIRRPRSSGARPRARGSRVAACCEGVAHGDLAAATPQKNRVNLGVRGSALRQTRGGRRWRFEGLSGGLLCGLVCARRRILKAWGKPGAREVNRPQVTNGTRRSRTARREERWSPPTRAYALRLRTRSTRAART